jgi:hypothetical protein
LVEDPVLCRQIAQAVEKEALNALSLYHAEKGEWVEAAATKRAVHFTIGNHLALRDILEEALQMLEKSGPMRTKTALQLELDIRGSAAYTVGNSTMRIGTPKRTHNAARVIELSQDPSLRIDSWTLAIGIFSKFQLLVGATKACWENGGERPDFDTIHRGLLLWTTKAQPLMQLACSKAVGARKVLSSLIMR